MSAISLRHLISPQNNWKTASQTVIPPPKGDTTPPPFPFSPQFLCNPKGSGPHVIPSRMEQTNQYTDRQGTQPLFHTIACGSLREPGSKETRWDWHSESLLRHFRVVHLTKLPTSGQKSLTCHQLSPSRRWVLGMVSHKSPGPKRTGCVLTRSRWAPGGWA